jgi:cysteine-rich repeat protein
MGWEACDDNNNVSGDGCSGDCKTIEPGYECLEWGSLCTPMCGNGHIEVYEEVVYDTDGTTVLHAIGDPKPVTYVMPDNSVVTRVEQCDFGTLNKANVIAGDEYIYPCDEHCQLIDPTKWDCSTKVSVVDQSFRNWPAPDYRTTWHYECEFMCGN